MSFTLPKIHASVNEVLISNYSESSRYSTNIRVTNFHYNPTYEC